MQHWQVLAALNKKPSKEFINYIDEELHEFNQYYDDQGARLNTEKYMYFDNAAPASPSRKKNQKWFADWKRFEAIESIVPSTTSHVSEYSI